MDTQNGKMSAEDLASLRRFADRPGLLLKTASGLDGTVGDRTTVHRLLAHIAAIQREAEADRAESAQFAQDEYLRGLRHAIAGAAEDRAHEMAGPSGPWTRDDVDAVRARLSSETDPLMQRVLRAFVRRLASDADIAWAEAHLSNRAALSQARGEPSLRAGGHAITRDHSLNAPPRPESKEPSHD